MNDWKAELVDKALRQISYRNNMSTEEKNELSQVLFDFLEEGILILRKWRKLSEDTEFVSGIHDNALVNFVKNKYSSNGREMFENYSSGGVNSRMPKTPESVLKSTCKQVI